MRDISASRSSRGVSRGRDAARRGGGSGGGSGGSGGSCGEGSCGSGGRQRSVCGAWQKKTFRKGLVGRRARCCLGISVRVLCVCELSCREK